MHNLLKKILNKRGINDIEQLDVEEKKTFESWNSVLGKDSLTIEDIKDFCQQQVELIENKWADYGIEQSKKAELIPYHTIYSTLLKVVDSPKAQREALERNLQQLLQ